MSDRFIYALGFTAQILFSSRIIVQWIFSEKEGKVATPKLFWQLSLLGSFLLFIYGWLRNDFAILLGQAITYFVYIRNIQLQRAWKPLPIAFRAFILLFPVVVVIYSFNNNAHDLHDLFKNESIPLWVIVLGTVAHVIFTSRFVYQWIYSERKNESLLPFGFWFLSLIGSLLILTYGVIRNDPVLFAGHALGSAIYSRNLFLLNRSYAQLDRK